MSKPITEYTEQELEDAAARLGGTDAVDRIHAEATQYSDSYPMIDDVELPDRVAAYRTVWRVRVGDMLAREQHHGPEHEDESDDQGVAHIRSAAGHFVIRNPNDWLGRLHAALNGPSGGSLADALLPLLLRVVGEDRQRLASVVNVHRAHLASGSADDELGKLVHLLHHGGDALIAKSDQAAQ